MLGIRHHASPRKISAVAGSAAAKAGDLQEVVAGLERSGTSEELAAGRIGRAGNRRYRRADRDVGAPAHRPDLLEQLAVLVGEG
jgi:hypothetical protein